MHRIGRSEIGRSWTNTSASIRSDARGVRGLRGADGWVAGTAGAGALGRVGERRRRPWTRGDTVLRARQMSFRGVGEWVVGSRDFEKARIAGTAARRKCKGKR
jgi:hypothetical protein